MNWIRATDKLPEPNQKVLIVRDVRKWDSKRPITIDLAYTGFFEEDTRIGGPIALTGYKDIKGIYFSVPAILHPEEVTHWMSIP